MNKQLTGSGRFTEEGQKHQNGDRNGLFILYIY